VFPLFREVVAVGGVVAGWLYGSFESGCWLCRGHCLVPVMGPIDEQLASVLYLLHTTHKALLCVWCLGFDFFSGVGEMTKQRR
jgi:hypothetical protein